MPPEKKYTILHIDDDSDDLQMLQDAIQSIDSAFEILQAYNGKEGLDLLKKMTEAAELPCLIVLDINMPKMNGKETFQVIKNDDALTTVPIVILSTSSSISDKLFFKGRNVEYITKPIDFTHFIQVATRLLSYCKS